MLCQFRTYPGKKNVLLLNPWLFQFGFLILWFQTFGLAYALDVTPKQVAVTFDDLPLNGPRLSLKQMQSMTRALTGKLHAEKVPAIGFVNENKLYERRTEQDARTALLKRWLDLGLELGNHTYSHPNLCSTTLAEFESDLVHGEKVTSKLLAAKGKELKYFRYPYLVTGATSTIKKNFQEFLASRNYLIAPVTIDTADWMFSAAYTKAKQRGDNKTCRELLQAYLSYTSQMFDYYENMAIDLAGRQISHVLVLHCNLLNADHFSELCRVLRRKNYEFVSLEEALKDPVYQLPENYVGCEGVSWLKRWRYSQGKSLEIEPEPQLPKFVEELYADAHYDD